MTKPGQQIPDINSCDTQTTEHTSRLNDGDNTDHHTGGRVDDDNDDNGFGDDFDDFKGGDADDDQDEFGDFDDGFQEPEEGSDAAIPEPIADSTLPSSHPILVSYHRLPCSKLQKSLTTTLAASS